jgi:hypothetical protein
MLPIGGDKTTPILCHLTMLISALAVQRRCCGDEND